MLFDFESDRRWLFCMTHPDDDISIAATIRRLVTAKKEVFLSWTHATPIREMEARQTAALLGVHDDHLFFHNSTDGSTCEELKVLLPKFKDMVRHCLPDVVVCGAFEQGHLDHDATNWLVNHSFSGPVYEVPFYHTYLRPKFQKMNSFSSTQGQEILRLNRDEWQLKLDVAKSYRSQNIWQVLLAYEALQTITFQKVELRKREIMRLQTHLEFRTPNHPEHLRQKLAAHPTWHRWLRALDMVEKGTL
jgi:LmbE family N-acetylglucosaminyl deacetylase